jgi:hypothetical protein
MVDQVYIERIAKRRAICARLMALLLLMSGISQIGRLHGITALRSVEFVAGSVWMVMIVMFVLVAGGGITRTPQMRAAIYDESTIEHGRRAFSLGFWVTLAVCAGYWIASLYMPIGGPEVVRAVTTLSISIALFRFATLEMKALKDE